MYSEKKSRKNGSAIQPSWMLRYDFCLTHNFNIVEVEGGRELCLQKKILYQHTFFFAYLKFWQVSYNTHKNILPTIQAQSQPTVFKNGKLFH